MISSIEKERIIKEFLTEEQIHEMLQKAKEVALNANCPYSKFSVGACILTQEGQYITGCNVENITYGLTLCAERTAIVKAISQGQRNFKGIVVYAYAEGFYMQITPCGPCRQLLQEFASFLPIICANRAGSIYYTSLHELLPFSFVISEKNSTIDTQNYQQLDFIVLEANIWLLKDNDHTTRDIATQLLGKWQFRELQQLVTTNIILDDQLTLTGKYYPGYNNINFITVQIFCQGIYQFLDNLKFNIELQIFKQDCQVLARFSQLIKGVFLTKGIQLKEVEFEDAVENGIILRNISGNSSNELYPQLELQFKTQHSTEAHQQFILENKNSFQYLNKTQELWDISKFYNFEKFNLK